jgi:cytochrome c554/c'-like protein
MHLLLSSLCCKKRFQRVSLVSVVRLLIKMLLVASTLTSLVAHSAESNIRLTKHNFSSVSGIEDVKATSESQVCVFCHAPHGATEEPGAPLWNRQLSPSATYSMYDSLSLEDNDMSAAPGGSSKLCLSCHDGTVAIGSVNVANGQESPTIAMEGTQVGGFIPVGEGVTTGFTRNLGTDLTNDHPISFTYSAALATADGELRNPEAVSHIGDNVTGETKPLFPTENGKLQCTTCHDPHLYDASDPNRKFLRGNRMQKTTPTGAAFDETSDQICLACHDKANQAWAMSVHANSSDANETYTTTAAALREFPSTTKVWQAGCLNCHDTHTVGGSRRLLREGVDSAGGITTAKSSGDPAIEETCYQCHRPQAQSVLTATLNDVPDIRTDFTTGTHMPITNDEQQKTEFHNITNSDFKEARGKIGSTNLLNRHVECTDCHNPHRVMKSDKFNDTGSESSGTHAHTAGHSNIASGALKGSFGVEPVYTSEDFEADPTAVDLIISFTLKQGVPSPGASDAAASTYVTREYQICLRCHSNYGFGVNPPTLGDSGGGTTLGTSAANGVTDFTNQAMEFQAPTNHRGEVTAPGYATNNHRSWHPVMGPTGRSKTERNFAEGHNNSWNAPWNDSVGIQTMYCSDCHGNNTANGTTVPSSGKPWGPHGSTNNFILKGFWDPSNANNSSGLCFRCHSTSYISGSGGWPDTGFHDNGDKDNLHEYHQSKSSQYKCNSCHVALPHGWKNKAFLVNLNDVGPECPGTPAGTSVGNNFTCAPYYINARLRVTSWKKSGRWTAGSCQGRSWMEDNCGG